MPQYHPVVRQHLSLQLLLSTGQDLVERVGRQDRVRQGLSQIASQHLRMLLFVLSIPNDKNVSVLLPEIFVGPCLDNYLVLESIGQWQRAEIFFLLSHVGLR
jgi:hypothetical protein